MRCRPRRRSPGWVVVIGVIAMTTVVQGHPVAAQWTLTPLWSDITPGRVTAEPWGLGSGEEAVVAVVTEDRRLRLRNSQGAVVAATRTGLRDPVGVLPEGDDQFLLIPPRASGAPLVRVDLFGAEPRIVGQPASVDSVIVGNARFVVADGESLVYAVSTTGLVTHASTASGVLWQRRLPAPPTATVAYRGAVYVALEDGRVFRFDGNGTGIELLRLSAPAVAIEGIETSSPAILTIDRDGVLTLVNIAGGGSNAVSIQWQVQAAAPGPAAPGPAAPGPAAPSPAAAPGATTALLDVTPPRGRSESWYAVVGHRAGGVSVVNFDRDVEEEPFLRDIPIDMILTGRLPSGGFLVRSDRLLLLVSETGTIWDQRELRQIPATVTWIDAVGQLILTYRDWSIEAWTVAPALVENPPVELEWSRPVPRGQRDVNDVPPGALTARAEAVFAGTSRTERSALLAEIRGQRRRAVLFDRVGEARSILRRLVREALEVPNVRDGRVSNDFPEIRRAAVEELGRYMDRTSRAVLSDVVRHDPDERVVATALRAFARYGVDEAGVTAHAVARFRGADDQGRGALAPAMITLLEFTAVVQRHPPAAKEALDLLIESNLSRDIRRRAATIERARYR